MASSSPLPLSIAPVRRRSGKRSSAPMAFTVDVVGGDLATLRVRLTAAMHPGVVDHALGAGAVTRARGFALPLGSGSLEQVVSLFTPNRLVPASLVRTATLRRRLVQAPRSEVVSQLREVLDQHTQFQALRQGPLGDLGRRVKTLTDGGIVTVEADLGHLVFRAASLEPLRSGSDQLWLGVLGHAQSTLMSLPEALDWIDVAQKAGITVVDCSQGELLSWARQLDRTIMVTPLRGAPGLAMVAEGRRRDQRKVVPVDASVGTTDGGRSVVLSGDVADVISMARAHETGREGLHDYQDRFVSTYLATEVGLVNALAPGLGKTVCAVAAVRERHLDLSAPRALVVVPSPLRTQWRSEVSAHYPDAEVLVCESGSDLLRLPGAWGVDGPLVVVVSYDLARLHCDTLESFRWDDLVVDEAALLRRRSARSKALWRLRERADRAMTLTGTPMERSIEDLSPLVAFSRGDSELFNGAPLQARAHHGLSNVLGPVVFGAGVASRSAGVPDTGWSFTALEASMAEAELLDLLVERLRLTLRSGSGLQGASAVSRLFNLCRAAACDPAAVADIHIPDDLRDRLPGRGSGLFHTSAPTKRRWVHDALHQAREQDPGLRSLVFTDFAGAAHALAEYLNASGLRTGAYTSKVTPQRRKGMVDGFWDGSVDVLVLSGLARQGLNLQCAELVIHYDVPASPSSATQRVGRAARLGHVSEHVEVLCPVMDRSIESVLQEPVRALANGGNWLEIAGANLAGVRELAERFVVSYDATRAAA